MQAAIQYIQRVFSDVNKFENADTAALPRYLVDRFNIHYFNLLGNDCVLVEYKEKPKLFIENINKDINQIKKFTNRFPVFVFYGLRLGQRESLIKNKIPFVVPETQIFIPYPPICLTETEAREKTNTEKFKKTTQVIFAYLLLNKVDVINAHRIADLIGCSVTTANRSLNELIDKGLLEQIHNGTRKKYVIPDKHEYWELGKKFLFNPISSGDLISETRIIFDDKILFKSGDSALCEYSDDFDENPNHEKYYACFSNNLSKVHNGNRSMAIDYSLSHFVALESLVYDPALLSSNGIIDPVTLYAEFMDKHDERVEMALDKIMEDIING